MNPFRSLMAGLGPILASQLRQSGINYGLKVITINDAFDLGYEALLTGHSNAAYAGRGLAGVTDPLGELDRAYGRLVADSEAEYFDQFLKDIKKGVYTDDDGVLNTAAIERRAAHYTERLRGTGNEVWANTLDVDELIHWRLGGDEGSACSVCPALERGGPYKPHELPTHPGNNETPCLFNCRCYLETESGTKGF